MTNKQQLNAGLTLLELLVVVAIAAVVASLGAPSMANFVKDNQIRNASIELRSSILRAKNEALAIPARVAMCIANSDLTGCAGQGSNWGQGWLIFVDSNNDLAYQNSERLIYVNNGFGDLVAASSAGIGSSISFLGTGFTDDGNGQAIAGTIVVCDARANPGKSRDISINALGRDSSTFPSEKAADYCS